MSDVNNMSFEEDLAAILVDELNNMSFEEALAAILVDEPDPLTAGLIFLAEITRAALTDEQQQEAVKSWNLLESSFRDKGATDPYEEATCQLLLLLAGASLVSDEHCSDDDEEG